MKALKALALLSALFLSANLARAQEGEAKEIDSVIARVNTSVILRSSYQRALQEVLEDLKAQGLKDQELEKKFNEIKPVILDSLIDQELLVQRAKELSLDCEPFVNEQLLRIMKENNLNSLEDLEQKMREAGLDIAEVRRNLRTRCLSEQVRNREVFGRIFQGLTEQQKREFYEKHKEAFTVPGEVTLSQILILTGKDEAQALQRAREVATQARSGAADFAALCQRHSEDEKAVKQGCQIGTLKIPELADEVREAVGKAPVGTVTDPIKIATGYAIFRVDQRKEPETKKFDDAEVQRIVSYRLTEELGMGQLEAYMKKLRDQAFIEIDPRYQMAGSKVKSVDIKRTAYSEEDKKSKKKKDKEKKDKPGETEKSSANVKPQS
jgi:peptidyl-prolyl cis-trans isomerase SurA